VPYTESSWRNTLEKAHLEDQEENEFKICVREIRYQDGRRMEPVQDP
jgi:hypothetical protein